MSPRLGPYPSPEARNRELDALAAAAGADLVRYGTSVEGEPLRAARLPCPRQGAPRVLCAANIHGPEYVGGRVATAVLERVAASDRTALALCERAEVWVAPCLNPDGYRRTWDRRGVGPLTSLRTNAGGVDLNRNFPRPPGRSAPSFLGAGSDRRGDATYRGPEPLSEPETRALHELLEDRGFHASANFHSFMGTVIPARVTDRSTFATYRALCRAFASAQRRVHYRRLSNRIFDVFTGEQEDHQHHHLSTWAVCVETFSIVSSYRQHLRAPSTFWRFNPHDPTPWINNDLPGLLAYFTAALELPRPGQG